MIDRGRFDGYMAMLCERHRHEISAPTLALYYDTLSSRMTTDQFVTQVRRHLMTPGAFFPGPGDLLPPVHERLTVAAIEEQAKREGLLVAPRRAELPAGPQIERPSAPRRGAPTAIGEIVSSTRIEGAA